jgi:putative ATP-binding cassette transporter
MIPRTPYFPPGTLREGLAPGAKPKDQDISDALAAVGLSRLSSSLDRAARWEHELNDEEMRLLAFAGLALGRPDWVIVDEALDTFDGETLKRVLSLLEDRLGKAAIINIGRSRPDAPFFSRTLKIVKDSEAPKLKPVKVRQGAVDPPEARPRNGKREAAE